MLNYLRIHCMCMHVALRGIARTITHGNVENRLSQKYQ